MTMKSTSPARSIVLLLIISLVSWAQAATTRLVKDMAGDETRLPAHVARVATVGPVPVLNSLVFTVGAGHMLINGLPTNLRRSLTYQTIFAPQIARLPALQGADQTSNLEALLGTEPDVVLTMDRAGAENMRRAGVPALYIAWRKPDDVKAAVRLLGELFERQDYAERYVAYFDATLARVATTLGRAAASRPRVLYFNPTTLTQPHLVAEWWIRAAGGDSVTDDGRAVESRSFTQEQLLSWNPDILIVSGHREVEKVTHDPRFAALKAVREGRILVAPCGAHSWGNRTAEQPLTVLWAAKQFHPRLFADINLVAETRRFYRDFFGAEASEAVVEEILAGGPIAK